MLRIIAQTAKVHRPLVERNSPKCLHSQTVGPPLPLPGMINQTLKRASYVGGTGPTIVLPVGVELSIYYHRVCHCCVLDCDASAM
jgi:hypothetical protein